MALDPPQVCLGLHMLPWTVHLQQTSGGSVAQPNASVPGLRHKHTESAQKESAVHEPNFDLYKEAKKKKTAPEESNYVNLLDVNIFC